MNTLEKEAVCKSRKLRCKKVAEKSFSQLNLENGTNQAFFFISVDYVRYRVVPEHTMYFSIPCSYAGSILCILMYTNVPKESL
jgi:hypothetical protein